MLFPPPPSPLRYDPRSEEPEAGEEAVGEELTQTLHGIRAATFKDHGHADRSVHAKSHGILEGELEIPPQDDPVLAQGLFQTPGRRPVVMRVSTLPGDIHDDQVSTPRGLAVKLFDVAGERLPGAGLLAR